MSWQSEHMNLPPLPKGIVRNGVLKVKLLKQTPANDKKMRKRHKDLYGNTKFTDEQILYFYLKHKGSCFTASADLKMSLFAFKKRLVKINTDLGKLKCKGYRGKGITGEQVIASAKKNKNNMTIMAKELGICYHSIFYWCKKLGIKGGGKKGPKNNQRLTKKYRDKLVETLSKNEGKISKTASELETSISGFTYLITTIFKIEVLGIGEYHK